MKKALSIVLTLAMLLSMTTVFASFGSVQAATTILGDLNGDGNVTAADSLILRKYFAGTISSINTEAADVNKDGSVNSLDMIKMAEYLAGAIDSFDSASTSSKPVKEMTIAGTDISKYDIVVTTPPAEYKADENYNYASRQLSNYISDAVGYKLNITYTPAAEHHIYLVFDDTGAHEREGYSWKVENDDLYIIGGTRRGSMYGVFDFLKEYVGWRFYEYKGVYCHPSELVSVPAGLDHTFIPQMNYRDVHINSWIQSYGGDDDVALLCYANHVNSHSDRAYCQSPKAGWGEGNVWANAHSFEYIYGISNQAQPCLAPSNYNNYNTAVNWVINLLSDRAKGSEMYIGFNLSRVSVSWNDNENYCMCAECKSVYQEEKTIAGTIARFDNRVCEAVNRTYPDVQIYYIAYGSARIPPQITKPIDNIVVCYCWNGCNNHLFGSQDCSDKGNSMGYTNWEEQYYFEGWAEMTKNLFAWYYATNFTYNIGPCPNILNIREDFRYLAEHGVTGIYAEGGSKSIYTFEGLRNYLMAECMWDPYMSEAKFQSLIDEYLEFEFGAGWKYIKEYLYMQDEAGNQAGCFTNNYDWPGNMYNISYMIDNYDKMVSLMDNATAQAKTTFQKENIEKLSVHMHFLALSGAFYKYGGISSNSTWSARYDTMYNLIQKHQYYASYLGVPNSYNKNVSPMIGWLDLEPDGRWESWYDRVGRAYPRDTNNMKLYTYQLMGGTPTRNYNPLNP